MQLWLSQIKLHAKTLTVVLQCQVYTGNDKHVSPQSLTVQANGLCFISNKVMY